jgi:hypothetical protein
MKLLFIGVSALALGLPVAAQAQSEVSFDYPHAAYIGTLGSQQANRPAEIQTPPKENCNKAPCLVVVNNTADSRVVEFRLDSGKRDAVGEVIWSENLLRVESLPPKGFVWWAWNQAAKSCKISIKIVLRAYGLHENELNANYELCGPKGPGLLVIRDPDDQNAPPPASKPSQVAAPLDTTALASTGNGPQAQSQ